MKSLYIGGLLGALFIGGLFGIWIDKDDVVVQACPSQPLSGGAALNVSETHLPDARSECSECLPRCSQILDETFEIYKKVHGLGAVVASRESLK